jgi:cytochrome c-type biogenesis protein CcmH
MTSFYISVSILSLLLIAAVCYGVRLKKGMWYIVLLMVTFSLSLWVNPDILHWYQFEKNTRDFKKAQAILKQPKQIQRLKQTLKMQVTKHPEDAKAWFLLGRMYASEGLWREAHDAVFQAYRLEQKNLKTAIFYVETIWQTQGQITPQARHILDEVLKLDEHQPDALILLAADANNRGCYRQAIGFWQRLLVLLPKDSQMAQALTEAITKAQAKPDDCH